MTCSSCLKSFGIGLLLFLGTTSLFSQVCTTPSPPVGYMNNLVQRLNSFHSRPSLKLSASGDYLINVVIITNGQGHTENSRSFPAIVDAVEGANIYLASSGLSFTLCGSPTYVDDSVLFYTSGTLDPFLEFAEGMDKPGYINLYTKAYTGSGSSAYSNYPGRPDRMVYSSISPLVMAHELGHFFSLIHTFGKSSFGVLSSELVDGSNCAVSGDYICDTPADPYPHGSSDPNCQYTGTILDANGDLYQPLTENIMSYYPINCWNTFTLGQDTRMDDVAEMDRAYLRQNPNPFKVVEFPHELCLGDSNLYPLVGSDPSGVFSGPGIVNNVLNPALLGPGSYNCTYTGTALDGDSVLVVGALQSLYLDVVGKDTADIWQAYEAASDKDLQQVSFRFSNDSITDLTLEIFQGIGTTGTLLHSQTFTIAADSLARWEDLLLNTSLPQIQGQAYTLALSNSSDSIFWPTTYYLDATPQLASSISSSNYFTFATWHYELEGVCTDTISFVFQIQEPTPNGFYSFEPNDPYCQDYLPIDLRDIMEGFYLWPDANGYFQVNGLPDTFISPIQLGPGTHEVNFIYTSVQGCPITFVDSIEIVAYPDIVLPDTVCLESGPISLSAIQPNGTFSWAGMIDTIFDPAAEGPGLHTINVNISNIIDTTYFPAFPIIFGGGSGTSVAPLAHYGQAFISDTSAQLDTVIWLLYANNWLPDTNIYPTVAFNLRKGEGLSGPILHTDTTQIVAAGFLDFKLTLFDENIFLDEDSAYTLEVVRLDSESLVSLSVVRFVNQNPIPSGVSFLNSIPDSVQDLNVEVWLRGEPTHCGENQGHEIFVQEIVIDTLLGSDITYLGQSSSYSVPLAPGITYQWTVSNGQIISGQGTESITVMWTMSGPQTISVSGISNQGCEGDNLQKEVMVLSATGIDRLPEGLNWQLFPNPAHQQITIQLATPNRSHFTLTLIDGLGRKIQAMSGEASQDNPFEKAWNLSNVPEGVYQIMLNFQGKIYTRPLVIVSP